MKLIIGLCLFTCALAAHVCFPEEFHTRGMAYASKTHEVQLTRVWYSRSMKSERYDFGVDEEHPEKEHHSLVLNFNNKKAYAIHYLNRTASCEVHPLDDVQEPLCLSKTAEHRGTITLGGILTCDNYVQYEDYKRERVMTDMLIARNINVPISSTDRYKDRFVHTEFWDFEESVHHDAFVLPDVCYKAELNPTINRLAEAKGKGIFMKVL